MSLFYLRDVLLADEYKNVIKIKGIALTYSIYSISIITVFNCRRMFRISFTLFYKLVELRQEFIFVL